MRNENMTISLTDPFPPVIGNAVFLEQGQELLLEGHLPVVLCQALDVLNARRSAVPAGLIEGRTCVPNVETLGYCRRVPSGLIHAGLTRWAASSGARPRCGNCAERLSLLP